MFPKVIIIILNWNGWKDTIECLESIYQVNYSNYDIIVVDNNSQDNSLQKIKEYCEGKIEVESKLVNYKLDNKPLEVLEYSKEVAEEGGDFEKERTHSYFKANNKLRLIISDKNYGFSEGNNIGIRYAIRTLNPDYILLLNNDTVVEKQFLDMMIIAEKDKKIGIVGPRINYYDFPDKTFSVGGKINWWNGNNSAINTISNKSQKIDYVSGCALLIKKEVINKIGLLPSEYFMYAEELDYCESAKKQGFSICNYPTVIIWHKISSSSESKFVKYYRTRNRFLFMKKFSSPYRYLFFIGWRFTVDFMIETFSIFYHRDWELYKAYLRGLVDGLFLKKSCI